MSVLKFFMALTFLAAGQFAATPAFAREYQITVSGRINNYSATLFGDSRPEIPIIFSFNVISEDAEFLPLGTLFNSEGYGFNTNAYKIPRNTITGLNVNIGNYIFTEADLIHQSLELSGNYDILITGGFENPVAINMVFNNAVGGELYIGALSCPTTLCHILPAGSAFSYQDGGFGEFNSLSVSSSTVDTTSEQKINSSILLLDGMTIPSRGVRSGLNAKLQAALRVLKVNDSVASKNILGALKLEIEGQRGKGLTDAQASSLISSISGIF